MSVTSTTPVGLRSFVDESEPWFRESLRQLVEVPTVSPVPGHEAEIRRGAEQAAALARQAGATAELIETAGTPSVLVAFEPQRDPVATLVVYNHLDVQPADAGLWSTPDPFTMVTVDDAERGHIYRARGTTDDKGPALCALRGAQFAATAGLPIAIRFLWETEEEIGSPHFADAVEGARAQLEGAAAVVVSDTIWPTAQQPAISVGLRGATQALLRLRTASQPAHSGLVGGAARNPLRELCAVATAIDRAAFWQEGVTPPTAAEIAGFSECGFDTDYFKAAHGLERLESEVPVELMLRLWTRPTFEIHGITGGYVGAGLKTIVPDAAELKISFRLVPDQDPEVILESLARFVQSVNPDVEIDARGKLHAYRAATTGPVHEAIAAALRETFGKEPMLVREGGSIGAVPILAERLGVPVHFLPLSLPEHGYHAPNENFDWRQARGGIEAFARLFANLAST